MDGCCCRRIIASQTNPELVLRTLIKNFKMRNALPASIAVVVVVVVVGVLRVLRIVVVVVVVCVHFCCQRISRPVSGDQRFAR